MTSAFHDRFPNIPKELSQLKRIAYNTWWAWNPRATELFRRIDPDLWEQKYHNPVLLLERVSQERFQELAVDTGYLAHLSESADSLDAYLTRKTWFDKKTLDNPTFRKNSLVAYFSAEFGLHESIPIYSGGLGVLAGDTLKSASDLGIPLVGVSLLYKHGYFSQYLNIDGWQQERYFVNNYSNMPASKVIGKDGDQIRIEVELGDRTVYATIWMIVVGRTSLFLLDTDLHENSPEDRKITGELYGGDRDMRIRQEIVLGIGGIRALKAMGLAPTVRHLNEGHSAFLILEQIKDVMSEGKSFAEAGKIVSAGNVFTTHTPVPAGNEEFDPGLITHYLNPMIEKMGVSHDEFLSFGRFNNSWNFSMTVLGLRFSDYHNAVSKLHGKVSREIWQYLWPDLKVANIPISHVTNGIHPESWTSETMVNLLQHYIGEDWSTPDNAQEKWKNVTSIPDTELWTVHRRLRERLVSFVREQWDRQLNSMGFDLSSFSELPVFDPCALTIGFARRFATYKRATLILSDEARLTALLNNPDRPIQLLFAGKAHPHDHGGKELIRQIVHLSLKKEFYGKIIYLEDYCMAMARYMVQGADVWLNTPRKPKEASGTSGMKACFNGVLHCSISDGWWDEIYSPKIGWTIESAENSGCQITQDRAEANALYEILENQMIPMFYDRDENGLPLEWIKMMKNSMQTVCPYFSSKRMLAEYTKLYYAGTRHPSHS